MQIVYLLSYMHKIRKEQDETRLRQDLYLYQSLHTLTRLCTIIASTKHKAYVQTTMVRSAALVEG